MILLPLYEAMRLGLNVKGTLAIIKKMMADNKVKIDDLDQFYQRLLKIKFSFSAVINALNIPIHYITPKDTRLGKIEIETKRKITLSRHKQLQNSLT